MPLIELAKWAPTWQAIDSTFEGPVTSWANNSNNYYYNYDNKYAAHFAH